MKTIKAILILILLKTLAYSQHTVMLLATNTGFFVSHDTITQKFRNYKILDDRFTSSDSLSSKFYLENHTLANVLLQDIYHLKFDKCRVTEIQFAMYIDSLNRVSKVDLIKGTNIPKIDSLIRSRISQSSGLWKASPNLVTFYSLVNISSLRADSTIPRGVFTVIEALSKHVDSKIQMCADDDFFFNKGAELFQKQDYKGAAYQFNQATMANPYDLDAILDFGLCYVKLGKNDKACKAFKEAAELGSVKGEEIVNQLCNQPIKSK